MDQETDFMKKHIDNERDQLTGNLREIESRFKSATDVREQFNKNPLLGLGLAFAGGFLLSAIMDTSRSGSGSVKSQETGSRSTTVSPISKLSGTLDTVFEAFVGLASKKIESYIADVVPGFHEQFQMVDRSESPGNLADFGAPERRSSFR